MLLLLTGVALWSALTVSAVLGAILGVIFSSWSSGYVSRELEDEWRPNLGVFYGIVSSILVGTIWHSPVLVFFIAAMIAYLISRFPKIFPTKEQAESEKNAGEGPPDRMQFRKEWNARPRFESEEEGLFVGREDFLNRLTSHFISKGGGTILISGVRGVGKTALVDRALVDASQKLQRRYWKETFASHFKHAPRWHFTERKVERALLELGGLTSPPEPKDDDGYKALKQGLDKYVKRPTRRFWQRLHPVGRRLRRMHEASRNQLFVLKFSASDISGALAEPDQKPTDNPRIDPERLLRAVIRKLFMTCHSSRQEKEAKILQWSLNKRVRQQFFLTLETAYNKSISKSYKEIITNSLNDFLKKSQSSVYEGKMSVERVVLLLLCLGVSAAAALVGIRGVWDKVPSFLTSGVALALAGYFTLTWTFKRSRESGSERTRQSQFSYEYDYSLDQMQRDVESLVRILHPAEPNESEPGKFDPYRCFRRSVVIFDEMDKLDDPDKQLDNVITHFKNFFTLSQAEFVFLTDHRFYEHLALETVKAQLEQHYPPQHTFFTEKLYLRKPEFGRFREAFYRFAPDDWLSKRANTLPADAILTKYLLRKDEKSPPKDEDWIPVIKSAPLETLTQLYIQREQYGEKQKTLMELEFKEKDGWDNAVSVAQIWTSQVSSATVGDFPETRNAFMEAGGWDDPEAVALLYYYRNDFGKDDEALINQHYLRLDSPSVTKYTTVDEAPFTLSDLARALCFQTRNHYFDLYNSVYDYVQSYDDGAPMLPLDDGRFAHEPRLWSRYQQLLEIAFDSAKEDHPSREYFNTLLMESLYKVFDTRGSGESISVSDVLFAANGLMSPAPSPDPVSTPQKVEDPRVSAFTGRDKEKINQAIIRLLRLALAHDAISSDQLKTSLTSEKVKPEVIANLKFSWKDNSLSIVRGDDAEQHEQALIEFWDKFKNEFEALDAELSLLWLNAPIAGEGSRMHHFIEELRTKAEGLRLKTGKVSRPDALALKANLGSTASRNDLMPRIVLERIRAEDDAEILEDIEKPKTQIGLVLEARKKEFESAAHLRLRAVICPRDTDCVIYFVASAIPANFDWKSLVLEGENTYVFWYVSGSETPPAAPSDKIYFCLSPSSKGSPAKLFADYVRLASLARLRQIISRWQASKDKTLALAAGAELIGPITRNSELRVSLARPIVARAITVLTEAGVRFSDSKSEAWKSYDIEIKTDWSASEATKALAETLANEVDAPLDFKQLIEGVLSNAGPDDLSSWPVNAWTGSFISASSDPSTLGRLLLIEIISALVVAKLRTADIKDPKFDLAARGKLASLLREFASLLAQQIVELTKTRGGDLRTVLSATGLSVELEKYRRTLKPIPAANATPLTPVSKPTLPGRLRRSKKPK